MLGVAGRVAGFRLIVTLEVLVLFLVALALTVAPIILLSAITDWIVQARDFAASNRPIAAFIGLLFTVVIGFGLWRLVRQSRATVTSQR